MTDEEKDVWIERIKALGHMGIATVLAVALSFTTYIEGESRNETMRALAASSEKHNEFTNQRNAMISRFVANQEKHAATLERLLLTLERK